MTQTGRLFLALVVLTLLAAVRAAGTSAAATKEKTNSHSLVDSLEEVGHTLHEDSIRLGEGMINGVKSAISKPSALDRFMTMMRSRLPHQASPPHTQTTNTTMNATTTTTPTNTTITHTPTTNHTAAHPPVIHPTPHPHPPKGVVIGSHESHGHGQSHLKEKKHHPKSKGYPGENPTVLQPSDRSACCYGCLWKGWGCEKKCRICCPEGQAAVCDNTPNCTCSSEVWKHGHGKVPIPHGPVIQHKPDDHLQQAYDHADSVVLMQRLKEVLKLLEQQVHSEKSSTAAKPIHPFHTMAISPIQHLNEITTSALSVTDIIIIVVVVVVVLFCCGGFGYSRYRTSPVI